MRLYLVRHGDAKPNDVDPDRSLTPAGIRETEKVAAFLRPLHLSAGAIWHSGKARAEETAELLAPVFSCPQPPQTRFGLKPDDDPAPIRREISKLQADLVIVGHLPCLARLASLLLADDKNLELFDLAKSTVACLELKNDAWSLLWMLTPEILP